ASATTGERWHLFTPLPADGDAPVALSPGDRLHLFDRARMRRRAGAGPGRPDPPAGPTSPATGIAEAVEAAGAIDPASAAGLPRIVAADTLDPATVDSTTRDRPADPGRELPETLPAGLEAVLDRAAVGLTGALAHPGGYPVAGPTTLSRLIDAAGGLAGGADPGAVEIRYEEPVPGGGTRTRRTVVDFAVTPPERLRLSPGDSVHVPVRPDAAAPPEATILGAVRRPGTYPLLPGERLSDLIRRAGGLRRDAFTAGAVMTRHDAAERERRALDRAAAEIERRLADLLAGPEPPDPALVDRARDIARRLRAREPGGRIVVEADPAVLRAEPTSDPILMDGDTIRYPVRPHSVMVTGAVMAPAALQYRPGKTVTDYLDEAGGTARDADTGRIFVLHPDGRARPVRGSIWRHTPVMLPAGSTIVVPRDTSELGLLGIAEAVGRVLGQVAIGTSAVLTLFFEE
ncbi:MAG: SLBB domain-containing protein, partial [Azospirillaceae bacterium]